MTFKRSILAISTAMLLQGSTAFAAVSAEQAAALNNHLTPVGAERAGNNAGDIPAWTGGLTSPPANYDAAKLLADPFIDEKAKFSITATNFEQYADALSDGQKAMFKKHPEFRMDIYPTHRTAPVPDWVINNTLSNAINAQLTEDDNGVLNAYGGVPFPIPQTGAEAIWNHILRWQGEGKTVESDSFAVYSNGSLAKTAAKLLETYPYYRKDGNVGNFNGNIIQLMLEYTLPTRRKGELLLVRDPINQAQEHRQAWQYIPGQRRVRRAPTIGFDTPSASSIGLSTYDESFMFNGSLERYNWTLVGKKEMFVPYNTYKFRNAIQNGSKPEHVMSTHFINPDYERWEKHRVWIVEANLKDGSRHIYGKRRFYIDEDSWHILMADNYDGRGELWRFAMTHPVTLYNHEVMVNRAFTHYDIQSGDYAVLEYDVIKYSTTAISDDKFYTPQKVRQLARR